MKKFLLLTVSHGAAVFFGFALGVYLLPILAAPPAPSAEQVRTTADKAEFQGEFRRDLADSDGLHWGEGTVYVGPETISLAGEIAPGPAYKLYLSPEFIETEARFLENKSKMALVGDVDTFQNFIVDVPSSIDPRAYTTVIVWCEPFEEFITAAKYR